MKAFRVGFLLLTLCGALPAFAQGAGDPFARARRLVNDGEAKAGRAVVDSMLDAAVPRSQAYAEALYWRGVLAEDGDVARTDLLRVAIEFPFSPRSADALLRLAQLEFTRGDRVTALRHLDQLASEHPDAPARAAGRYWTARLLIEDAKPEEACVALREAQRLAAGDVELMNQIEYYLRWCATTAPTAPTAPTVDSRETTDSASAKAAADSAAKAAADSAAKAVAGRQPTDGGRQRAEGRWSVQVAAYGDRDNAQAMVRALKTRGLDARVTPDEPWRVRVGHYATRAEAAKVAQRLSSRRSKAMVVEAEKR